MSESAGAAPPAYRRGAEDAEPKAMHSRGVFGYLTDGWGTLKTTATTLKQHNMHVIVKTS